MSTSIVLIRTKNAIQNITSANVQLKCSNDCMAGGKSSINVMYKKELVNQLQITSLSIQKVFSKRMLSTKQFNDQANHVPSTGSKNNRPFFLEQDRFYNFAVEHIQQMDYHALRHAVCCPYDSWILLNFFAVCLMLLLISFLKIRFLGLQWPLLTSELLMACSSLVGLIFFLSAQYLFMVWVQDILYVDKLGQSVGGYALYCGILSFTTLLGLASAFGAIYVLDSAQNTPKDDNNQVSGLQALVIWIIAIVIFFVLVAVICFIDFMTSCLGKAFWFCNYPLVCPQQKEKVISQETLSI